MLTNMVGSRDGKALCLYLPLTDKLLSDKVFEALNYKINSFNAQEAYYITGLPVAEGAVGVEMFTEMKLASPLAMLVIFGLLLLLFRKWVLVMLPIFLMSISIVDCIHVLSEFFDVYTREKGRKESIRQVINTLFAPMLYTSLTTSVGFLSLTLTSIPPARIFGLFFSFGVMLAWLCTIMFVPAYLMFIPDEKLKNFGLAAQEKEQENWMTRGLRRLGQFTRNRPGLIMGGLAAAAVLAVVGIFQTRINDNYSKRFAISHPTRQADIALNTHFGGTYTAYLVLESHPDRKTVEDRIRAVKKEFLAFADRIRPDHIQAPGLATQVVPLIRASEKSADTHFLDQAIAFIDTRSDSAPDQTYDTWQRLGDYLRLEKEKSKPFKQPGVLSYMAGLKKYLEGSGLVGKASSVADIVSKVNQELIDGRLENYRIPNTLPKVAECYMQYQQSHRPQDLWHRVSPDFSRANIMLQIPSGNSMDMAAVVDAVDRYLTENPLPGALIHNWAGLHYVNLFFQNKMFWDILWACLQSFLTVLVVMTLLFRSLKWGVLCMVLLSITIAAIYGTVGILGKDYDMPVAVISVLSIGIAVDFAIHFLERARNLYPKIA